MKQRDETRVQSFTGLRLPDQEEFQLFTSDHSFERYDLRFKELFGFERAVKRDIRYFN